MRNQWAKVRNGRITHRWLPNGPGELSDGSKVSRYADLPESVLVDEGWVRVNDEGMPDYDSTFYSGTWRDLEVIGDEVYAVYRLIPQPPRLEADGTSVIYYDITREGEDVTFTIEGDIQTSIDVTIDNGTAEIELDPQGGEGAYTVSVGRLNTEVNI